MKIRSILRPERMHRTPMRLGEQLGVPFLSLQEMQQQRNPRWGSEFFLFYPHPNNIDGYCADYKTCRQFFKNSKFQQRMDMKKAGLRVIESIKSVNDLYLLPNSEHGYVIRPMDHERGEGYRVVKQREEFEEDHYMSPVFPKTHEYRLVFVFGKLAFMQKKQPFGRKEQDCWSNTDFYWVKDVIHSYLMMYTDAIESIQKMPALRLACLAGIDVLYNHRDHDYRVCEVNACPALTAETSEEGEALRQRVIDIIGEHRV